MNASELAGLFRDANITINVQNGTGTMYTGPVQINNHQAAPRAVHRCYLCGRSVEGVPHQTHFGGAEAHWSCIHELDRQKLAEQQRNIERLKADEQWQVISDQPLEIEAPPVEPQMIWVRDDPAKYAHLSKPYHIPLVQRRVEC